MVLKTWNVFMLVKYLTVLYAMYIIIACGYMSKNNTETPRSTYIRLVEKKIVSENNDSCCFEYMQYRATQFKGTTTQQTDMKIESYGDIHDSFIDVVRGYIDPNKKSNKKTNANTLARWHKTNSSAVVLGGNYMNGVASGDCLRFRQLPLCTNKEEMDILLPESWYTLFKEKKPHILYTEHVFEHLTPVQVLFVATMSFHTLAAGGVFRVVVPDGYKPGTVFHEYIRPPKMGHVVAWNVDTLPTLFELVGFRIRMREYYNAQGVFKAVEPVYSDDWRYGQVLRSAKYDPRQKISNTQAWAAPHSLWFDAIKPDQV